MLGDRVEPPQLFARGGVVRADEALFFAVGRASAQSLNQLALGQEGAAARAVVALRAIPDGSLPDGLAGPGIERNQLRVAGCREYLVLVNGDPAHRGAVRVRAVAVFPDQIARAAINRLHDVARVVEIDDPVVHERRRLIRAAFIHRPDPLKAQILHVVARDLIQRTVIRSVVVASNHEPVVRTGIAQHRVGHRHVILHFAGDGDGGHRRRGSPPAALPTRRRRRRCASSRGLSRRGRRATRRSLTGRNSVDRGAGRRRQRLIPGRGSVGLEDEGCDAGVLVRAQCARPLRRHGQLHEGQQLARRPPAPGVHEFRTGERGGVTRALEIGQVAGGTLRLIGRPARRSLRRGIPAARRLLAGQHEAARRDGKHDQHRLNSEETHGVCSSYRRSQPHRFPSGAFSLEI